MSDSQQPPSPLSSRALDAEPYIAVSAVDAASVAPSRVASSNTTPTANGSPTAVSKRNWKNHPAAAGEANGAENAASAQSASNATPFSIKAQLAQMLKGGVIMDVTTPEEARIAEAAGACAVMALERIPSQIRAHGGVARMSHPSVIAAIQQAVSIPVMAKVRVGHFVEAQILQAMEVDFVDESEVLTPADDEMHIDKRGFQAPFVCGCRNLGEALRRIQEGAAMIRTKGEAGTGNVVEAVRHARQVDREIRRVCAMKDPLELQQYAREIGVDVGSLLRVQQAGRLPVVQFAAGGIATPADAALMMQLGMDGVFVGSGIFASQEPRKMAEAIVQAVTHYKDPVKLAQLSATIGEPMKGLEIDAKKMVLFATREQS